MFKVKKKIHSKIWANNLKKKWNLAILFLKNHGKLTNLQILVPKIFHGCECLVQYLIFHIFKHKVIHP